MAAPLQMIHAEDLENADDLSSYEAPPHNLYINQDSAIYKLGGPVTRIFCSESPFDVMLCWRSVCAKCTGKPDAGSGLTDNNMSPHNSPFQGRPFVHCAHHRDSRALGILYFEPEEGDEVSLEIPVKKVPYQIVFTDLANECWPRAGTRGTRSGLICNLNWCHVCSPGERNYRLWEQDQERLTRIAAESSRGTMAQGSQEENMSAAPEPDGSNSGEPQEESTVTAAPGTDNTPSQATEADAKRDLEATKGTVDGQGPAEKAALPDERHEKYALAQEGETDSKIGAARPNDDANVQEAGEESKLGVTQSEDHAEGQKTVQSLVAATAQPEGPATGRDAVLESMLATAHLGVDASVQVLEEDAQAEAPAPEHGTDDQGPAEERPSVATQLGSDEGHRDRLQEVSTPAVRPGDHATVPQSAAPSNSLAARQPIPIYGSDSEEDIRGGARRPISIHGSDSEEDTGTAAPLDQASGAVQLFGYKYIKKSGKKTKHIMWNHPREGEPGYKPRPPPPPPPGSGAAGGIVS
ncbi:hypothetical protein CLAFUW4_12229 [Fulvia fulva]|uniref:Uncharacterized protein n=1 Tax=Passalora fulva TaxID=5499 RepID=A0A9Q8PF22_PASFU|nr:uncharacterized protein CLAFUR5_11259 [Fulvia fulva]KAK4617855.1 hypothetical protein CLAFUR4_12234 [Fulvia fulva]KAK4618724.1 hypothetical protein CLAFUR0_12245 [Fulvia fulva]UJO21303.1 hypothetical protein CLAFUR5_11259 [Fulvia fulva]WPV18115.1 hypothetical protein CLAFUW4_12229 [Fulvia fulva]WPV32963.1 hypothetical protein CLAFUW7_12236 [Fulvia fulva]